MCGYQGYEFGAGVYPDSVCIDGNLYDADNCDDDGNLYDHGEDMPCPMCRPRAAMKRYAENSEAFCTPRKEALAAAKSLVKDIRKNRGVLKLYGRPGARRGR